jgi:hypothetical protein
MSGVAREESLCPWRTASRPLFHREQPAAPAPPRVRYATVDGKRLVGDDIRL